MLNDDEIQKYLTLIKESKESKAERRNIQDDLHSNGFTSSGNIMIDPTCDIRGIERMKFGKNVVIQRDCWLNIAFPNPVKSPMITIEEGTNVGRRCIISAANKITIGRFVLIAPNVFIADTNHEYQRLGIPIMHQGITTHDDEVTIGDETWIGINAVIMGKVKVGRHCVIGANIALRWVIRQKSLKHWMEERGCGSGSTRKPILTDTWLLDPGSFSGTRQTVRRKEYR
jgi:acetyltransferase-like isoleucine patch superfamily enzyme